MTGVGRSSPRNGIPLGEHSRLGFLTLATVNRTFLYVPANRLEQLWPKATNCGTDAVIADLEDGVAPSAKNDAREALARHLATESAGPTLLVRIGAADDLDLLASRPDVMVVLPKADLSVIGAIEHRLGSRRVTALVESATGLVDLLALARHPAVDRLALGEADLRADLGLGEHADHALWPIRTQLVVASRAADIDPPVGPVATDWKDLESLRRTSVLLRAAGFGGRSAIHPDQVATIATVFRPSADEIAAARRIVEIHETSIAAGTGVSVDDRGRMIDEAVVRSARRVLG